MSKPEENVGTSATATCPAGKVATGGGARTEGWNAGVNQDVVIYRNYPTTNSWTAAAIQLGPGTNVWTVTAYVICAS